MTPPNIESSTRQERERYIKETFVCKSDCDMCGMCKVFKGRQPEIVYEDYIEGIRDFAEISAELRR